jgi:ferredoxin
MTYVVTEDCIRCRFMDCVEVCPVPCFSIGETMVVIVAADCVECGLCETACPSEAIVHESDPRADGWLEVNRLYATRWPSAYRKGPALPDADRWKGITGKRMLFSPEAGRVASADSETDNAGHAGRPPVPPR